MIAALVLVSVSILLYDGIQLEKFNMDISDALWLIFLGVLCTALAFLLTIEVVKKLGAFTVTLSINMEPVYTIFLAIFMLNENKVLNNQFYYGAVFIVGIVLLNALIKAKFSSQDKTERETERERL
jgi:drug/metabolite transporter (DMT)-like permease